MPASELVAIPDGASIFIDANILIYHFSGPTVLTPACSDFLTRVEDGAIRGFTSTIVLIEVLHRLMILEAVGTFQLPARDALRYVKEHPHQAKTLVVHQASVQKIRQIGVEVVTVGVEDRPREARVEVKANIEQPIQFELERLPAGPPTGTIQRRGRDEADMVYIPAGTFTMGDTHGDGDSDGPRIRSPWKPSGSIGPR